MTTVLFSTQNLCSEVIAKPRYNLLFWNSLCNQGKDSYETIPQTNHTSGVEAKHSEVKDNTATTISCVVTGLTKQLDGVKWKMPDSGDVIVHDADNYTIDDGSDKFADGTQTTTLTIPGKLNTKDSVYMCEIQSDEHGKTTESPESIAVNSKIFSELSKTIP